MRISLFCSTLASTALIPIMAQVNLKGRVLEKANLDPVPNALVSVEGSQLSARTNANGEFTLSGSTSLRPGGGLASEAWPLLQGRYLGIPSRWIAQPVLIEAFNSQGVKLASRRIPAADAHGRLDVSPEMGASTNRFLRVSAAGESFRFRLPPRSTGQAPPPSRIFPRKRVSPNHRLPLTWTSTPICW